MAVTDIDQSRLDRASLLFPPEYALHKGIHLHYVNTEALNDPAGTLLKLTGGKGYNDVFIFAPVESVIGQGDKILAFDGCLNFFAGPDDPDFKAKVNFYNVHYNYTHIIGTSGGNSNDMKEALEMMSAGLDPAGMVTHIGGLDAVIDTTMNLPKIAGGKKLIYTHISMPLTAISEFEEKGESDPFFRSLAEIVNKTNGLWNVEAEDFLLSERDSAHI
jgi:threonine dehydrogenase-like Zn-dependent dehydrogenase